MNPSLVRFGESFKFALRLRRDHTGDVTVRVSLREGKIVQIKKVHHEEIIDLKNMKLDDTGVRAST